MVTKIAEKMTFTILFSLLFVKSGAMDNSFVNRDILLFENYCQNEIILPDEYLIGKEDIFCADSVLANKEWLLQVRGDEITGNLFDVLCSLDMINKWNIYKKSDINPYSNEEFVDMRKRELELFYLGKLKLSKNFNSFLILVTTDKNDDYNIVKTVFLVNVAGNKITSITRMCIYTCFDGECNYIYTEMSGKGVFIQKVKEVSSDVILPKEFQPEKENTIIKFIYDNKGVLKIL